MSCILRYWPLLMMWLLIVGVLCGIPFASQWLVSRWITETPSYRLSWFVIASSDLVPGDRLTQDQTQLRLDYLVEEKTVPVRTVSSALNRYVHKEFRKGKPLERDSIGPVPLFELAPDSVIVPVAVKAEYAEGLKSGMRLRFERAKAQEPQTFQTQNTKGAKDKESGSLANVKRDDPKRLANTPEEEPLVVTLKAVIPSQDKKTAVLYVLANSLKVARAQELTSPDLIPFIIPSGGNKGVEMDFPAFSGHR